MPTMTDPRELFLHELGDVLYAENVMVKALPKMAEEAEDPELRAGFEEHLEETRGQIENLKTVFEQLGEKPKAEQCPAIEGIKAEHDEFLSEHEPSPEVCDLFLTGSGARTEHYEIAAYTGLITMAKALGESEAASLLEENLEQEKAAADKLEAAAERLAGAAAQDGASA